MTISMHSCMQGLTEPFQAEYKELRQNVVLTILASSVTCALVGYLVGRYFSGGKRR